MKYVITVILFILFCIVLLNETYIKYGKFYIELDKQAEMLNDRIDRILYVKVLQEGDTLYFISDDLLDTFWITQDTSWIEKVDSILRIEYGLEFTDTFSNDRYLTGNEGLYLMDDGVLGVSKDVPIYPNLYLMGDVFVYPDQFSGNTYVINAEGDTIFKYIKRKDK